MSSLFTKIINGEIPCHKIAEDNRFIAFLDINPLSKGHTLVIPKKEIDYIFDLDDSTLSDLIIFAKKIALAIDKYSDKKRVGVAVIGLEVAHAHIHLVPIDQVGDINFASPKLKLSHEELASVAEKIRAHLK